MTTPDETQTGKSDEKSSTVTWVVSPPTNEPKALEFYESLVTLLEIYEPAETELDSDKQYTTAEIIQAVELHYNVPQGDLESRGIDGQALVDYLKSLGFKYKNTGGLMLQWLMKRKA